MYYPYLNPVKAMPKVVFNAPDKMYKELKEEANEQDLLLGELVRNVLREREKIAKYDFGVEEELIDEEKLDEAFLEHLEELAKESEDDEEDEDEDEDEDDDEEDK